MANRDIFDVWFFMQKQMQVNTALVESRMDMAWPDYIQTILEVLEKKDSNSLLDGIGELVDPELNRFTKKDLLTEVTRLLRFYKEYPII